jgi:hypothetical protein
MGRVREDWFSEIQYSARTLQDKLVTTDFLATLCPSLTPLYIPNTFPWDSSKTTLTALINKIRVTYPEITFVIGRDP